MVFRDEGLQLLGLEIRATLESHATRLESDSSSARLRMGSLAKIALV